MVEALRMSATEVTAESGHMALALNGAFLALSKIPLAMDFFPKPYKATTTVRIGVGLAQEVDLGDGNIKGNIPNIALFDGNGNQVGTNHEKNTINQANSKTSLLSIMITPIMRPRNTYLLQVGV